MQSICESIANQDKPLVLKGGTALLLAYNLERFSEDLDFDLEKPLQGHVKVESLCQEGVKSLSRQGIRITLDAFDEVKKTPTTHRCRAMFSLGEGNPPIPLKIEISSRGVPDPAVVRRQNNIKVYSVSEIARLKLLAAEEVPERQYRTAARDLHDLAFIAGHWEPELPKDLITRIEQFFADPVQLMDRYADAYDEDPLLHDRLFQDLAIIEAWNAQHSNKPAADLLEDPNE